MEALWHDQNHGGGWEEDDDLEDLSDVGLEDDQEEDADDQEEPVEPVREATGATSLGAGIFMGRLTRFIEAVTQPEDEEDEEEEEEGDGWGDDEDDLEFDDDDNLSSEDDDPHDDNDEYREQFPDSQPSHAQHQPHEDIIPSHTAQLNEVGADGPGWDDGGLDDVLEDDPADAQKMVDEAILNGEKHQSGIPTALTDKTQPPSDESGWDAEIHVDTEPEDVGPGNDLAPVESAWDEDDLDVSLADDEDDLQTADGVVDHTPCENVFERRLSLTRGTSLENLGCRMDNDTAENDDDRTATFGPVVDHTPTSEAGSKGMGDTVDATMALDDVDDFGTSGGWDENDLDDLDNEPGEKVAGDPPAIGGLDTKLSGAGNCDSGAPMVDQTPPENSAQHRPSVFENSMAVLVDDHVVEDQEACFHESRELNAGDALECEGGHEDNALVQEHDGGGASEGDDLAPLSRKPFGFPSNVGNFSTLLRDSMAVLVGDPEDQDEIPDTEHVQDGLDDDDLAADQVQDGWEEEDVDVEGGGVIDRDIEAGEMGVELEASKDGLSLDNVAEGSNEPGEGNGEAAIIDRAPHNLRSLPAESLSSSMSALATQNDLQNETEDDIDDAQVGSFGPVVDQLPDGPNKKPGRAFSFRNSMAVLVGDALDLGDLDEVDSEPDEDPEPEHKEMDAEECSIPKDGAHVLVDHTPSELDVKPGNMGDTCVAVRDEPEDEEDMGEQTREDNFGPVVDHTPSIESIPAAPRSVELSMAVQASELAFDLKQDDDLDTTLPGASVDDGWEHAQSEFDTLAESIAEEDNRMSGDEPTAELGNSETVVDHIPEDLDVASPSPLGASMAVLAPLNVGAIDEDATEEDTGTGDFGLVVDHTPIVEETSLMRSVTGCSMDVLGAIDDEADLDTVVQGGASADNTQEDRWDDVDVEKAEGGMNGPNAVSDLEVNGHGKTDFDVFVIDHMPNLEETSTRPADQSLAVQFVVDELKEDEDEGDSIRETHFGPMVDHTPTATSVCGTTVSQGNSMAVQAQDLDFELKEDDAMDETCGGGGSTDGTQDGWDQDEQNLHSLDEDQQENNTRHGSESPVVDHVPQGGDIRPTDASTLVVADPSDALSHVDDMGHEEGNYGPVVDQTPSSRPSVPPSAAGSTAVMAPPSEIADDLDDADDTADEHGWDHEDPEIVMEEAPNPQSANDEEANRHKEQVVDYLPPPARDAVAELNRDSSSEMATGGAQSLLPTDDPKEDEFGPIVDHTPVLHSPGQTSSASQRALVPAEERKVPAEDKDKRRDNETPKQRSPLVADQLHPAQANYMDSTGAIRSEASEDEDLDDDKFGPVVDHLPVSRLSLPPSRGGSTVDALATVSEVDDDDLIGDGWEEEIEIDDSDRGGSAAVCAGSSTMESPARTAAPSAYDDKMMTVKFRSVVDTLGEDSEPDVFHVASQAKSSADGEFFDPELGTGGASKANAKETSASVDSESSKNGDVLIGDGVDGNTPPSSVANRPNHLDVAGKGSRRTDAVGFIAECKACADATSLDCPCVQSILYQNGREGRLVGSLVTPEGERVEIDFDSLLQNEITKRKLLEEESQALRSAIEALKTSKKVLLAAGESQMETLMKLQRSEEELSDELGRLRNEFARVQTDNKDLQSSLASAENNLQNMESRRVSELEKLASLNSDLSLQVERLRQELLDLQDAKQTDSERLAATQGKLEDMEKKEAEWQRFESVSKEEIEKLKLALASVEAAHPQEEVYTLQKDLESKADDCEKLGSKVAELQQRLVESEGQSFRQTKELARLVKHHDQEMNIIKGQLSNAQRTEDGLRRELDEARHVKELTEGEVNRISVELNAKISDIASEKETLVKRIAELQSEHDRSIREQKSLLHLKNTEVSASVTKLKNLEKENAVLVARLQNEARKVAEYISQVQRLTNENETSATQVSELTACYNHITTQYKDLQEQKNSESNSWRSKLNDLEVQNSELASELAKQQAATKGENAAHHREFAAISKERDDLREALAGRDSIISEMQRRLEEGVSDGQNAEEISRLRAERDEYQAAAASSKKAVQDLSAQIDTILEEKDALAHRLQEGQRKVQHLETALATAEESAAGMRARFDEEKKEADNFRERVVSLEEANKALKVEREELLVQLGNLENEMTLARNESQSRAIELQNAESFLSSEKEKTKRLTEDKVRIELERDRLNARCQELSEEVSKASKHSAREIEDTALQHKAQLALIANERDSLRQRLDQHEASLRGQGTKLDGAERALSALREQIVAKDSELAVLQGRLGASDAQRQQLQGDNRSLHQRLQELGQSLTGVEGEKRRLLDTTNDLAQRNRELEEHIATVLQERDGLLREQEDLKEENDEMLVQFGLLKEEMDTYENQVGKLFEEIERKDEALEEMRVKLDEAGKRSTQAPRHLEINGDHHGARFENERSFQQLALEKSTLEQKLFQADSLLAQKREEATALTTDNKNLAERVGTLLSKISQLESAAQARDGSQVSTIHDLQQLCNHQKDQLALLQQEARRSQLASESDAALREHVVSLERECARQEERLKEKDSLLNQLEDKLSKIEDAAPVRREFAALQSEFDEMERKAAQSSSRIQELESVLQQTGDELHATRERLTTTEASLGDLEINSHKNTKEHKAERERLDARVRELELTLASKTEEVARLHEQRASLHEQVVELRAQLNTVLRQNESLAAASNRPDSLTASEIHALKIQIGALQDELKSSLKSHTEREQQIQDEVNTLQVSMTKKDEVVSSLEKQLQNLGHDLMTARMGLKSKEDDVNRLTEELEELRSEKQQSLARLLGDSSECDNIEELRATISTLALDLELAETRRAEAIDRLKKEREVNAASIRQLCVSMKRFYSTITHEDS